jgi:hypothetical protein
MRAKLIQALFESDYLDKHFHQEDCAAAPAALPDASLDFLLEVSKRINAHKVFEFGSGRSTRSLLSAGMTVFSLEDSEHWLRKSLDDIPSELTALHQGAVESLRTKMLGWFPVLDWRVEESLLQKLVAADLVLVDSPYYTPFRESSLWTALLHCPDGLVILDDTRIPTLSTFCDRIAAKNPWIAHKRVKVGHGFDLFWCRGENAKLSLGHSMTDCFKGWRRYFLGRKFYADLA